MYIGGGKYELITSDGLEVTVSKEEVIEMLLEIERFNGNKSIPGVHIETADFNDVWINTDNIRRNTVSDIENFEETEFTKDIDTIIDEATDKIIDESLESAREYYEDKYIMIEKFV